MTSIMEAEIDDLKERMRKVELRLSKRAREEAGRLTPDNFEGKYIVNDNYQNIIVVKKVSSNIFDVRSPGAWRGTGFLKDGQYWGVFEYEISFILAHLAGTKGYHHGIVRGEGLLDVKFANIIGQVGSGEVTWRRAADITE